MSVKNSIVYFCMPCFVSCEVNGSDYFINDHPFINYETKEISIKYAITGHHAVPTNIWHQLEQLERLRSEDTPRRPMITPYYWPVYFESQVHINDQLISDPKSK